MLFGPVIDKKAYHFYEFPFSLDYMASTSECGTFRRGACTNALSRLRTLAVRIHKIKIQSKL